MISGLEILHLFQILQMKETGHFGSSNRGRLKGYHGEEKFIDKNALFGTKEQFKNYPFK